MSDLKYKTVAIDSGGELARLLFSWELKKEALDYENIRQMNDYPGMTERLAMIMRRLKDFRKAGIEVVVIFHDDIDKLYVRGSAMAKKGQNNEPTAIKPRISMPGNVAPDETMKIADNLFRVRAVNGKPMWVCVPETVGPGAPETWQVKDRFNAAKIAGAYLPPSYFEIATLMTKTDEGKLHWNPPYIWMPYGTIGMKKTLSLTTFPKPIRIFDTDGGTGVLTPFVKQRPQDYHITEYNSEDMNDYPRFLCDFEETLGEVGALTKVKAKLGIK